MSLVKKQFYDRSTPLLDVIELTPKELCDAIQCFTIGNFSVLPFLFMKQNTQEFDRKILSGNAEIEGSDPLHFILGNCDDIP